MTKVLIPRSDSISAKVIEPSDFEKFTTSDILHNYIKSGFTVTAGSGLAANITVGTARISGLYVEETSSDTVSSLTASNTNYIYITIARDSNSEAESWSFTKNVTGVTATDSMLIAKVVTNGSSVTSVDQLNEGDSGGSGVVGIRKNAGIPSSWIFASGIDGDVTLSSNTTLTSVKYYNNLTITSGAVIDCNFSPGLIYVKNKLTITSGGVDIAASGSGTGTGGGAAGAGGASGAGPSGASGGGVGTTQRRFYNVLDWLSQSTKDESVGGKGGTGGNSASGAAGNTGYQYDGGAGAGGAGGSAVGGTGGTGGGSLVIIANEIVIESSGYLKALGLSGSAGVANSGSPGSPWSGNNWNGGGNGGSGGQGGAGGGGGGGGGTIMLIYNSLEGNSNIDVSGATGGAGAPATGGSGGGGGQSGPLRGGSGGAGSAGATAPAAGTTGGTGSVGTIIKHKL